MKWSNVLVEDSDTFHECRNYSKQFNRRERLHDSTPLGATEFPPEIDAGETSKRTTNNRIHYCL